MIQTRIDQGFCQLQGLDFTTKWQRDVRRNTVFVPDALFQGSFYSALKYI